MADAAASLAALRAEGNELFVKARLLPPLPHASLSCTRAAPLPPACCAAAQSPPPRAARTCSPRAPCVALRVGAARAPHYTHTTRRTL
jgi:hypothetical protein